MAKIMRQTRDSVISDKEPRLPLNTFGMRHPFSISSSKNYWVRNVNRCETEYPFATSVNADTDGRSWQKHLK